MPLRANRFCAPCYKENLGKLYIFVKIITTLVVGKGVDKYHFFQGGLNLRNNALNSGSQPGLDPSLSALFRGFCAPLEKVVFVDSFPYYSRRLTKTLLFVSFLTLLSWLPLVIFNCLIYVFDFQIPWKFYYLVNVINYSNSFVNPVVYALRPSLRC